MNSVGERSEVFAPGLLDGQVALVTGGGTGLGKASALELVRCGAHVTIVGRRSDVLEDAAAEINASVAAETRADWLAGDVRDGDQAGRIVRVVLERHGRLDVLVNNAGGQFFSPAELIAAKGWRAVWRLNVEGGLNMAEAAFELAFDQTGTGTVVNVTLSPHNGMPGMAHSGSARATVEALTRELARRWQPAGVTVTAVAAGHFDTEVLAKYPASVRAGASKTGPAAAPRHGRGARVAGRAARLAAGARVQRLDDHARRRPRQLVRTVAAAGAGRRGRGGAHGGAAVG